MWNMEICKNNYVNTTGILTVDSNTTGVANLIDRNRTTTYQTEGYNGTTATVIDIQFASPVVVSRIGLSKHNLKAFSAYYNDTTTNTFTLDGDFSTSTISYTGNSETSHWFVVSSQTVSSLQISLNEAITATSEKFISELYTGDLHHRLTQNPSFNQYNPKLSEVNFMHKMSDGGTVRYFLADKFKATLKIPFISEADRAVLRTTYETRDPVQFVPFPTALDWDGDMFNVNWSNGFDFFKLTSNIFGNGYNGQIDFMETESR